ncbi:hypothetical protein [Jidongwangia harbinensis]|uniref:hypothetical protein n=1 Tax=Jidongwangia harbinensis TaxID=2878561 RepID=UPI001CD951C2|nr:hypothetical protein [Jidongwangia harbinensis]MCA2219161.1 hypothetical protein [Jidongwangia harbinensis]
MNQVRAELRKLLGLPSAWLAVLLGLVMAPAVVLANAPYTRRTIADGTATDLADLGFRDLAFGIIGPLVLGVVAVSSEYRSTGEDAPGARQLTASLTAMPHRLRFLAAKTAALTLVVAVLAAAAAAATIAVTAATLGDHVPPPGAARVLAAVLYWVLTALLAYAVTLIARNGIVPLVVFVLNSSVVSVSYLLTKVTDLAVYLPDIAGAQMFVRGLDVPVRLSPLTAGLVLAAWVAALLSVGAALFHRRDP